MTYRTRYTRPKHRRDLGGVALIVASLAGLALFFALAYQADNRAFCRGEINQTAWTDFQCD